MEIIIWKVMQVLINGIFVGGIYCLISVGLTMIVGVMKVVNFSQGECLTVGMYATLVLQRVTGWDPLLLILPVALIMYLFGTCVYELVINPIADRDKTTFTITTLGIAGIISTALTLIFSAIPQTVESFVKTATWQIGPFAVAMPRVIAFGVMLVFVTMLDLFLKKTDMGRAMRATAENKEISQMLGINTHRVSRTAFSMGIMFAGIAGLLLTPTYYLYPTTGGAFNILAMCCVVIGGLGNVKGAIVSGLLIGVVEAFIGTYVSVDLSSGGAFLLLLLVLVFMPNGLFGKGERVA